LSTLRSGVLRRIDKAILLSAPLEALQSYAFITGSSPAEVLQHFLSIRLTSTKSALTVSSPDSRTILHVILSIKSTITDVNALFPFTFQRTQNELKSTSLLSQPDLHKNLQRRGANIDLWIQSDLKKFLVWTKSDVLDSPKVENMLHSWMDRIETLLIENVGALFVEIQELEILCGLREEVMSSLVETEEELSPFERRICVILVKEIAAQILRLMTARVHKIHGLEIEARNLISGFKCIPPRGSSDHSGRRFIISLGTNCVQTNENGTDTSIENVSGATVVQGIRKPICDLNERDRRRRSEAVAIVRVFTGRKTRWN